MFTEKVIANNIKSIIDDQGLKQRAVAAKAGFNKQEFSNMLNGRKVIKAVDVPHIAVALGVTPNDLYAEDQNAS